MTNKELNAALYEKMSAEQDQFVGWLQIAAANGRWCGAKRPQCGASGHL